MRIIFENRRQNPLADPYSLSEFLGFYPLLRHALFHNIFTRFLL